MKVILLQDIKSLGKKGDIVETAEGYGRNYLLPRKLAKEASAANLNQAKQDQANGSDQGKDKRGQVIDDCQRIACSVNAGCPDAEGQHHHRIQGKQFLLPSLHLQWCGLFFCFCVFLIFQ